MWNDDPKLFQVKTILGVVVKK